MRQFIRWNFTGVRAIWSTEEGVWRESWETRERAGEWTVWLLISDSDRWRFLQVPLKTRYFDDNFEEHKSHLIQRSQICSTRFKEDEEPILFCDFLSDVQLVMQDFALDILNNYVELKKELIATYKINSLGIYKKIFVENYSEKWLNKEWREILNLKIV